MYCDGDSIKKEQYYRYVLTGVVNALDSFGVDLSDFDDERGASLGGLEWHLRRTVRSLVYFSEGSPSTNYKRFHRNFRETLNCEEYRQALCLSYLSERLLLHIDLLHKLCMAFFMNLSVYDFCLRIVGDIRKRDGGGEEEIRHDPEELEEKLRESHRAIKEWADKLKVTKPAYWISYVKDQMNLGFDPFARGNMPHVFFRTHYLLGDREKIVRNIRSSTPTCEDFSSILLREAKVNPEYRGFLEACSRWSRRHLYVNLQNRKPTFLWKNESSRCSAIEKLQEEYPSSLTVVGLAKDSSFYWQAREYQDRNDARKFKEKLSSQIFGEKDSGFFFPKVLLEASHFSFKEDVSFMISDIHKRYFSSSEELLCRQRMDFIEIFYVHLIEYLIFRTDSDSYNISCKDCIDRAGGMNGLLFLSQYFEQEERFRGLRYRDLEAIVFSPAVFVRQREIKSDRLERMISAAKRLMDSRGGSSGRFLRDHWKVKKVSVDVQGLSSESTGCCALFPVMFN